MPAIPVTSSKDIEAQHPLLFASDTPNVPEQFAEFKRAGGLSTLCVQRDRNERIRFNRWKGRTSDYRKHRKAIGADAIPWENAWDGRVHLADNIIEDCGDVLSSAEARAQLKSKPTEAGDIERAARVDIVLNKYRDRMRPELKNEGEFLWQFGLTQGASILQVGWDYQIAMKNERVTLKEMEAAAAKAHEVLRQMPPQEMEPEMLETMQRLLILPQLVADPAMDAASAELFQQFARDLAAQMFTRERENYGDDFLLNYNLSKSKALHLVRELRARGTSTFPAPYVSRNQPFVVAREVGVDYLCPPEMTDPQTAAWHIVREWLTPEEIYQGMITDNWTRQWCDEAVKTAGQTSLWGDFAEQRTATYENDDETDSYDWHTQDGKSGLVEVVHFFKRYVTEEGVPQIWCTVWCPNVANKADGKDLFARHYEFEDLPNRYPFAGYRWQQKKRQFTNAMGVPQIVGADQWAIKTSLDMLMDLEQQTVSPQWLVDARMGLKFKTGAGAQIPRRRPGDAEMVQPPSGHPELAFNLVESTMKRVSNYFGLMNEHVLPAKWQSKLQRMTERYLGTWAEAWGMVLQLVQRNASAEELARIAGGVVDFPKSPEEIAGGYDIDLFFDVKDLDMEFVFKKLDAIIKMAVPLDSTGEIDRARLVKIIMMSIDPTYATATMRSSAQASQAIFNDVRQQVALMERGNAPDFVENDPTARLKMQFTQEIIQSNPLYQAALAPQSGDKFNPVFAQRLEQWVQNLSQSVKQEQNKQVGRIGVNPELQEMGA